MESLIAIMIAMFGSTGLFNLVGKWISDKQKSQQNGYSLLVENYNKFSSEREKDFDELKKENIKLQKRCTELELALQRRTMELERYTEKKI